MRDLKFFSKLKVLTHSSLVAFAAVFAVSFGSTALASNSGVTYQGRILKPDGSALSGANVQFKLQIRTPDAAGCLMYEELQALDMSKSNGSFSLTINDGTGSRTDSNGLTLDRIFANRGSFALDVSTCTTGGGAWTPNTSDGRNLVVQFKDETMSAWEPIPAQKINFVPFAFESKQVGGYTADSLLRVVGAGGDPLTGLSPLSNAQYTELMALIGGTSASFSKLGGGSVPALSSLTNGQVLSWNGTSWVGTSVVGGASSVTSTMIASGAVGSGALASGAVGSAAIANNVTINTSGSLGARDIKIYPAGSGTGFVEMQASPSIADGSSYLLKWPATAGAANQVLTTDGFGVLSWAPPAVTTQWTTHGSNISYDGAGFVGIGTTSPTAALDLGSGSMNIGAVLNSGGGVSTGDTAIELGQNRTASGNAYIDLHSQAGTDYNLRILKGPGIAGTAEITNTGDGSSLRLFNTGNSPIMLGTYGNERMRIDGAGNVGIGTTAPSARLQLPAGVAAVAGAPLKFTAGTLQTTPEDGAMEYTSGGLYFTQGATRYNIPLNGSTGSYSNVTDISNSSGSITMTPAANSSVIVAQATASASPSTGALVVNGGVGVGGALNTTGAITTQSSLNVGTTGVIPQLYGSTAASGSIRIDGTSNAAKGNIYLAAAGGRVGIGTTNPTGSFEVQSGTAAAATDGLDIRIASQNAGSGNQNGGNIYLLPGSKSGTGTTGSAFVNGSLGVQGNDVQFGIASTAFASTGSATATSSQLLVSTNAAANTVFTALDGEAYWSTNTSGATSTLVGVSGVATAVFATPQNLTGGTFSVKNVSGLASTVAVAKAGEFSVTNTQPIATGYGVYIGTVGATKKFSLYANDSTAPSYFAGNVGIGTTSPLAALDVNGQVRATSLGLLGNMTQFGFAIAAYTAAGTVNGSFITSANSAALDGSASLIAAQARNTASTDQRSYFGSVASPTGYTPATVFAQSTSTTALVERMRIDSSGNVGIGTTSPSAKLDVSGGSINVGGTSSPSMSLTTNNNAGGNAYLNMFGGANVADGSVGGFQFLNFDSSWAGVDVAQIDVLRGAGGAAEGYMKFSTKTQAGTLSERMRIAANGNIGVGVITPTAALHLKAGTATASTAPLKFTAGTLLTTAEDGAMEYTSAGLWFTIGTTRYVIPTNSTAGNYSSVSNISNSAGSITLAPIAGSGAVLVNSGTASLNATSGALVVTGGMGVSGDLNTTGNITTTTGGFSGVNMTLTTSAVVPQIYGGTAASANIKIDGANNAAKGNVLLASAGGNVGIGTTAPGATLDVNGIVNVRDAVTITNAIKSSVYSGNQLLLANNQIDSQGALLSAGDSLNLIIDNNNDGTGALNIRKGNGNPSLATPLMIVTNSGKVGIGTTAPNSALHVNGDATIASGSTTMVLSPGNTLSGALNPGVSTVGDIIQGPTNAHLIFDLLNNDVDDAIAFRYSSANSAAVDKVGFVFKGNGNVGIGTTSPLTALQVAGTATANSFNVPVGGGTSNFNAGISVFSYGGVYIPSGTLGGTTPIQSLNTNAADGAANSLVVGSRNAASTTQASYFGSFSNASGYAPTTVIGQQTGASTYTERLRIDGSGNVGIGTTAPGALLDVNGTIRIKTAGSTLLPSLAAGWNQITHNLNITCPNSQIIMATNGDYDANAFAVASTQGSSHLPTANAFWIFQQGGTAGNQARVNWTINCL